MVLRVPAGEFDDVMTGLAELGQLVSTTSSSEDVTTQLIDVNARIKAQQASVERVRQLLAQAQSIRDIMAIESELSQRQADLDSLTQQQAYLKDQTSLSTIRVSIERQVKAAIVHHDHAKKTGFLAGLDNGWDGLSATVLVVLTVVGALLPFALVVLLLGAPAWLVVRRFRRSPAAAPAASAAE
jgi:multidrug efflux pump subunit AcrA (membrane-fusion protein)